MPINRRKPAPHELAAVLQRLQRVSGGPVVSARAETTGPSDPSGPLDPTPPRHSVHPAEVSVRAAVAARLPAAVRHGLLDPGRRGLAALAVLALLAALGGAWYFVSAQPRVSRPVAQASTPSAAPSPTSGPLASASGWPGVEPAGASSSPSSSPIVVDVVGKVASPGVVELPAGARIRDAVAAAGGAIPGTDLTALDLASKLQDGQQVFVGIPPPTGAAALAAGGVVGGDGGGSGGGSSASGSAASIVNLNTASEAELEVLPGVGPALAQRILDWRAQHGRFTSVAQLQDVSGIGPAKFAALKGHVTT